MHPAPSTSCVELRGGSSVTDFPTPAACLDPDNAVIVREAKRKETAPSFSD